MRYKQTKLILASKNSPLGTQDMITLWAYWEDQKETVSAFKNDIPKMKYSKSSLEKSVGLWNFFKNVVYSFKP